MHSGKIDLWQGCHKMGEKGSKIVPLGAPFFFCNFPNKKAGFWALRPDRAAARSWSVLRPF